MVFSCVVNTLPLIPFAVFFTESSNQVIIIAYANVLRVLVLLLLLLLFEKTLKVKFSITWIYYIPVSYASCFLLVMFNLMFAPIPSCHTNDQKGSLFSHTLRSTDMPKQERFLSPVRRCIRYAQKRVSGLSIFGNVVFPVWNCIRLADLFMQTSLRRILRTNLFFSAQSHAEASRTVFYLWFNVWCVLFVVIFDIFVLIIYIKINIIFLFAVSMPYPYPIF